MIPVSLEGLFEMLRRLVPSSTKVQMSSWANFYRKLAHEARLRAVQATTVRTGKILAMECSTLTEWVEQKGR